MKPEHGKLWISKDEFLEGQIYAPSSSFEISAEIAFITSMTGYPETLTDPSFAGQFICFTSPMIGNYSWYEENLQSKKIHCKGVITHRTDDENFIRICLEQNVPVITHINTRLLTLKLRDFGARVGTITTHDNRPTLDFNYDAHDWVKETSGFLYAPKNTGTASIALWDLGAKQSIYDNLVATWGSCDVLPYNATTEDILKYPRLMVGNGPGNPAILHSQIKTLKSVLGKLPIQAICLGHQLTALALDGKTYKMKFGHRGTNHPVQDLRTKKVYITSQNHGFAVDEKSLPSHCEITHVSLFDGTVEGFRSEKLQFECAQFHPEASPGPEDGLELFKDFHELYS